MRVLVREPTGVGDQPHVQRRRDLGGELGAELLCELEHDLRRRGGVRVDRVDVAEACVVVVVVDVEDAGVVSLEPIRRHPIDVSAVEEDDDTIGEVGGRLVEDLLQRQEPILDGKRELLRRQEHHRVLSGLAKHVVHREQRAQGVPVRVLVRREQEPLAGADLVGDRLQQLAATGLPGQDARRLAH